MITVLLVTTFDVVVSYLKGRELTLVIGTLAVGNSWQRLVITCGIHMPHLLVFGLQVLTDIEYSSMDGTSQYKSAVIA